MIKTLQVYCQCDRCKEQFTAEAAIKSGLLRLDYHPHIDQGQGKKPKHYCGGELTVIVKK